MTTERPLRSDRHGIQMIRELLSWLAGSLDREMGLIPPEEFRELLESERMRVDRGSGSLALLVLDVQKLSNTNESAGGKLVLQSLVGVLRDRLRGSDHVGMLDDRQLGVILTETGREGAEQVIRDLVLATPNINLSSCCEVFVYPSSREKRPKTGRRRSSDQPSPSDQTPDKRESSGEQSAEANEIEEGAVGATQSLQVLFVTPLPLWKRAIDCCGALIGLILAAPVIFIAALLVKLTSPGPAFFSQPRMGLGGRTFRIYKLRTMYADAEARKTELQELNEQDGAAFKIAKDPRVTPLGRILRKTCIDELPQLWNVLRGDMSLVGPRPLPCQEAESCQDWERRRLEVTPGLTCSWQVLRDRCSFRDWMRMDIRYIRARSFFQDVKLMFKTIVKVLVYRTST